MLSPMATALLTKVRSLMDMACTRIMRALLGQEVRPITNMTFTMLEPNIATIISTRKNEGIIRNTLMTSLITLSSLPP